MRIAALILAIAYIAYLVYEKYSCGRDRASFLHVIHVNGIRGKTGTCRRLDAALRAGGFKVFTKTTGSTPVYIDTAGTEHEIRRPGPPNIREQMRMIRLARKEGAQILILECMAVDPQLQKVSQERIVRGDWNVITNVRYDHTSVMGETLEEIAESLSGTIPRGGVLFTADEAFYDFFAERCGAQGSEAVLCRPDSTAPEENEAVAWAVARKLGIPEETFRASLDAYQEDFGASRLYTVGGRPFLNLFSANDPQSTRMLLSRFTEDTEDVTFVYNNRYDRPDRVLLFARYFFPDLPCRRVYILGESRRLARRLLQPACSAPVETAESWEAILRDGDTGPVVGIGNIKGDIYSILQDLEEEVKPNE